MFELLHTGVVLARK